MVDCRTPRQFFQPFSRIATAFGAGVQLPTACSGLPTGEVREGRIICKTKRRMGCEFWASRAVISTVFSSLQAPGGGVRLCLGHVSRLWAAS